jgi:hypothetical protein
MRIFEPVRDEITGSWKKLHKLMEDFIEHYKGDQTRKSIWAGYKER